ncbi:MAG: hypothetical protein FWC16_01335 [Defluviitaleaceae bacterium]|nr:hypothetical protein [Defluviitaleaceae bacterium]MCL2273547.1 hypothetical protein [Defluviitaleaceae bacterium]
MHLDSTRLVLRYNPGQFTFNRFDQTANDEALYTLAKQLNAFQNEDDEAQVVKIQVFSLW